MRVGSAVETAGIALRRIMVQGRSWQQPALFAESDLKVGAIKASLSCLTLGCLCPRC